MNDTTKGWEDVPLGFRPHPHSVLHLACAESKSETISLQLRWWLPLQTWFHCFSTQHITFLTCAVLLAKAFCPYLLGPTPEAACSWQGQQYNFTYLSPVS